MGKYTLQQRLQIVEIYFKNHCSVRATYRALREFYGQHNRPSESAIQRLIAKFRKTYSLVDEKPPIKQKNVRTEENIASVNESVRNNPKTSIRRRAQELGLCPSTTWKILRKDLGLRAYKIQLVQEIKPSDHKKRRDFADFAHEQLAADPEFYRKIWFSDEAHFWLDGYVNKQNCRVWADENPQEIQETQLYPQKLTVWCALSAKGIIGPYIFRNAEGAAVTVNGQRYRQMLNDFFFEKMREFEVDDMWFQQDGATCHTATESIDLLKQHFGNKVISRFGPKEWPPRSCDPTPLDYYLWGYLKSIVYANKPTTLEQLESNIIRAVNAITTATLEKVAKN